MEASPQAIARVPGHAPICRACKRASGALTRSFNPRHRFHLRHVELLKHVALSAERGPGSPDDLVHPRGDG